GFEAPTGEDRRRASTRVADGVVQAQFPDELPGLGSADDEGLRADVDRPRGEVRGLKRATDPGRRLVHVDPCLRQLTPELVGGGQPTDTAADHRDPGRRHYFPVSSWTRSTTWVTAPGSVAGRTPWPRLNTCPGAPCSRARAPSSRIRRTSPSSERRSAKSRAGSRLPCRTLPGTRRAASSSGTRQSAPTTSTPASPIAPRSSPVPTPKCVGGPGATISSAKRAGGWGSTSER